MSKTFYKKVEGKKDFSPVFWPFFCMRGAPKHHKIFVKNKT
jgi:truncated hemoglobin YjbI